MSEVEVPPPAGIDYPALVRDAGRDLVRKVLRRVAAEGLPGEHHIYLSFDTTAPGVDMSPGLRRQHPERMTIVLQHQYWDLEVDEEDFGVTLRFGGRLQHLRIPFAALFSFVDPAAGFGLDLQDAPAPEAPVAATETPAGEAPPEAREGDNLLRFDRRARADEEE